MMGSVEQGKIKFLPPLLTIMNIVYVYFLVNVHTQFFYVDAGTLKGSFCFHVVPIIPANTVTAGLFLVMFL